MHARSLIAAGIVVLAANGCRPPDVEVKETTIDVVSDTPGIGRPSRDGDTVRVAFHAALPSGEELFRDDEFTFVLGAGRVILGVEEAVRGMKPHGVRVFVCPPHKHWGTDGYTDRIPENTPLRFHVTLLSTE